jgi:hypothetical protein
MRKACPSAAVLAQSADTGTAHKGDAEVLPLVLIMPLPDVLERQRQGLQPYSGVAMAGVPGE